MYGIWLIPWPGKIKQILCSDWLPKQARWPWSSMKKILLCQFFSDKAFSVKMTRHMACFCVFTDVDYSCQSIKHNLERISPSRYLTILTSCFKSVNVHMHRRRRRGDRGICSAGLPYILVMKQMWMYLTILVTLVTSESSFSALRLLKNCVRTTMKQDSLNNTAYRCIVTNWLLAHYTLWRLQRGLLAPTNNAKGILENLCRGTHMAEWKKSLPRLKTLHHLWHVSIKVIITLDNQGKMQPWWNICSQGSCLTLSPI